GRTVLVVEDVATTAGQMLLSTADLRDAGAKVGHALVVIDRLAGGREALAGIGVELHALFTRDDRGCPQDAPSRRRSRNQMRQVGVDSATRCAGSAAGVRAAARRGSRWGRRR